MPTAWPNLYLYATDPSSTATVNVAERQAAATSSSGVPSGGYSYIADPATAAYSELIGLRFRDRHRFGRHDLRLHLFDVARLDRGQPHANDVHRGRRDESTLSNFPQVYVVGAADGTDSVTLDSAGGTFVGTPGFSYISGTASGIELLDRAPVCRQSSRPKPPAGTDTAVFYSYPNNTFNGAPWQQFAGRQHDECRGSRPTTSSARPAVTMRFRSSSRAAARTWPT